MKRLGLTPHLLSATLFLIVLSSGFAAEEMTPAAQRNRRAEELLKRFDKNGDGKLDDDERADAKEAMMKEQIARQMAAIEKAKATPGGPEAFRALMLELFDKNHDGRLDDDERASAQKFAEERGLGPGGNRHEEFMKRFDKNGNGRIDPDEVAAVRESLGSEKERLDAMAAELKKRRQERENAAEEKKDAK